GSLRQRRSALPVDRRCARGDRTRHLDGCRRGRRATLAAQRPDPDAGRMVAERRRASRAGAWGARMSNAVVGGGGPNGLAAAICLAAEGVEVTVLEAADEIGGGARSSEAIVPGLLHDHCSAVPPMAVGSQFLSDFPLDRSGLSWRWPELDCVHPLDDGTAGVLHRSVEQTAAGLGRDGSRWELAFGYPAAHFDALSEDIMRPLLRFPHHPLMLARFGAPTVLPASAFARFFRTEQGRALFRGVAAHAFRP